ncbi:MAG: hypothetical protein AAFX85_03580 [Pseudomonadota bacterium]
MSPMLHRVRRSIQAWSVRLIAVVLLVAGLIVFPFPIPLGLPMIVVGLALLISSSDASADLMTRVRRRHPRLDNALRRAEPKIPSMFRSPIRKTDPLLRDAQSAPEPDEE